MREIKFRAWYKGEKFPYDKNNLQEREKPQMINEVHRLYDGMCEGDEHCVLGAWGSFGGLLGDEDFVIMQYTGIKDKNGAEIYEGDIVTIHPKKGYEHLTLYGAKGVVEYSYGSYIVRNVYDKNDFLMIYVDLEVIGNIYETPEKLNPGT